MQLQLSIFRFLKDPLAALKTKARRPKPALRRRQELTSSVELLNQWRSIRQQYFPDRPEIDQYLIVWSTRPQKRTLASCSMSKKMVRVAREMRHPDLQKWLEPLLYHEMCHAVLGLNVEKKHGKRHWHGRSFKNLERQHPAMAQLDAWIKSGGWARAVRSDRSRQAHQKRK